MKHETRYIAPLGLEIGFTIGQNALENIEAINDAKATDMWFMNYKIIHKLHIK